MIKEVIGIDEESLGVEVEIDGVGLEAEVKEE